MATLNIENVPNYLYQRLQKLAKENHLSLDTQVIELLEKAITTETKTPQNNLNQSTNQILKEIQKRRRLRTGDFTQIDSTELIREDRAR